MKKIMAIVLLASTICFCGCLTARQAPAKVLLLNNDKEYILPSGQEVNLIADNKPIKITFTQDMVVMSSENAVKKQIALNDAELKKIKAEGEKKKMWGIIASLLTALVFGLGLAFKAKAWFPKKVSIEAK
jgi:hypothetical protein